MMAPRCQLRSSRFVPKPCQRCWPMKNAPSSLGLPQTACMQTELMESETDMTEEPCDNIRYNTAYYALGRSPCYCCQNKIKPTLFSHPTTCVMDRSRNKTKNEKYSSFQLSIDQCALARALHPPKQPPEPHRGSEFKKTRIKKTFTSSYLPCDEKHPCTICQQEADNEQNDKIKINFYNKNFRNFSTSYMDPLCGGDVCESVVMDVPRTPTKGRMRREVSSMKGMPCPKSLGPGRQPLGHSPRCKPMETRTPKPCQKNSMVSTPSLQGKARVCSTIRPSSPCGKPSCPLSKEAIPCEPCKAVESAPCDIPKLPCKDDPRPPSAGSSASGKRGTPSPATSLKWKQDSEESNKVERPNSSKQSKRKTSPRRKSKRRSNSKGKSDKKSQQSIAEPRSPSVVCTRAPPPPRCSSATGPKKASESLVSCGKLKKDASPTTAQVFTAHKVQYTGGGAGDVNVARPKTAINREKTTQKSVKKRSKSAKTPSKCSKNNDKSSKTTVPKTKPRITLQSGVPKAEWKQPPWNYDVVAWNKKETRKMKKIISKQQKFINRIRNAHEPRNRSVSPKRKDSATKERAESSSDESEDNQRTIRSKPRRTGSGGKVTRHRTPSPHEDASKKSLRSSSKHNHVGKSRPSSGIRDRDCVVEMPSRNRDMGDSTVSKSRGIGGVSNERFDNRSGDRLEAEDRLKRSETVNFGKIPIEEETKQTGHTTKHTNNNKGTHQKRSKGNFNRQDRCKTAPSTSAPKRQWNVRAPRPKSANYEPAAYVRDHSPSVYSKGPTPTPISTANRNSEEWPTVSRRNNNETNINNNVIDEEVAIDSNPLCVVKSKLHPNPRTKLEELQNFRNENYFETHYSKKILEDIPEHKCVHRFKVDERLYPYPMNSDAYGQSRCTHCNQPMKVERRMGDNDRHEWVPRETKKATRPRAVNLGGRNNKMEIRVEEVDEDLLQNEKVKVKPSFYSNSHALRFQKGVY